MAVASFCSPPGLLTTGAQWPRVPWPGRHSDAHVAADPIRNRVRAYLSIPRGLLPLPELALRVPLSIRRVLEDGGD